MSGSSVLGDEHFSTIGTEKSFDFTMRMVVIAASSSKSNSTFITFPRFIPGMDHLLVVEHDTSTRVYF